MKVTLSEFVVKSLIESNEIDLIYVQPKYLVHFLAGLKYSARNYGVGKELSDVLKDGSAMKFTALYEEVCAIVATFGARAPNESEVMQRLQLEKAKKVKEFRIWSLSRDSANAPEVAAAMH